MQVYRKWIGRQRSRTDMLDRWRSEALAATLSLDLESESRFMPPLWHWVYLLETPCREFIGSDGHTVKGVFLPPVPNPRRVFGGARVRFVRPMRFNQEATVRESVSSIVAKSGRSGEIYIVTISRNYFQDNSVCIEEQRDIIYLPAVARDRQAPQQATGPDEYVIQGPEQAVDRIALFRFSALTFNPHRIHYDERYAMEKEGHKDLVVHGPLLALLLIEHVRKNIGQDLKAFSFRAARPIYKGETFQVCNTAETNGSIGLAIRGSDGAIAMTAQSEFCG